MATAYLYQPTDMANLPSSLPGTGGVAGPVFQEYDFKNGSGTEAAYIQLLGSFYYDNVSGYFYGTINDVALDTVDDDGFPNIVISDLHYSAVVGYIDNYAIADNYWQLSYDMLKGKDTIVGSAGADTIEGYGGADLLQGRGGNDQIGGGLGADTLVGGKGADSLFGESAGDTFRFNKFADSPAIAGAFDLVADFHRGQGDKVDISHIDANTGVAGNQAFEFIGTANFTGNATDAAHRGELRYTPTANGFLVLGDVNGDKVADFEVEVDTLAKSLHAADFLL